MYILYNALAAYCKGRHKPLVLVMSAQLPARKGEPKSLANVRCLLRDFTLGQVALSSVLLQVQLQVVQQDAAGNL